MNQQLIANIVKAQEFTTTGKAKAHMNVLGALMELYDKEGD